MRMDITSCPPPPTHTHCVWHTVAYTQELDIYEEGVKRLVKTVERFQGDTRGALEGALIHISKLLGVLHASASVTPVTQCTTSLPPPHHSPPPRAEFLEAAAAYATRTPSPRVWVQGSSTEAATPSPTHVPAEHAALFDAGEFGERGGRGRGRSAAPVWPAISTMRARQPRACIVL
jgi:hypothetical protein